jgi:hypothetical protein
MPYCATLYIAFPLRNELIMCVILPCNKNEIYIYIYKCVEKVVEGVICYKLLLSPAKLLLD